MNCITAMQKCTRGLISLNQFIFKSFILRPTPAFKQKFYKFEHLLARNDALCR
jgi:hypothetical protein